MGVLEGRPSCLPNPKDAEHTQHFEWEELCQGKVSTVGRNEVKSQHYRARGAQLLLSIPMKSNPIHFFSNSILNQILIRLIEGCQELSFQGWGLGFCSGFGILSLLAVVLVSFAPKMGEEDKRSKKKYIRFAHSLKNKKKTQHPQALAMLFLGVFPPSQEREIERKTRVFLSF